jgi:hypothetical protein
MKVITVYQSAFRGRLIFEHQEILHQIVLLSKRVHTAYSSNKNIKILTDGGISKRERKRAEKIMRTEVDILNRFPSFKVLKKIPKLKGAPIITPLKKTFHFGK